jgi:hypothetical protein
MRFTLLALALLVSAVSAPAQTRSVTTALNALRRIQPTVRWDETTAVVADVTCSGTPDTLLIGYQSDKVWLGAVHTAKPNGTPKVETFPFQIGQPTQDSFCAVPVRIETAPIDCETEQGALRGCKSVKGCREFSLVDGACDSFHFYWDSAQKMLTWWRR